MMGWLSPFGIIYRSGRAPLLGALVLLMLAAPMAQAKGPVVSSQAPAGTSLTLDDYLLMLRSIF